MGSLVAELAEKLSSATNNFDIDEGTIYVNTSADTVAIGGTSPDGKFSIHQSASADILNLYDGTTAVFTVLDGGNVGVGTTTPDQLLVSAGTGNVINKIEAYTTTAAQGPALILARSNNGSLGTQTAVDSGDMLGAIYFQGSSGTAFATGPNIQSFATETFSGTATGGDIRFFTTDNTTTTSDERMRINHNGRVGIGTTDPSPGYGGSDPTLEIAGATSPSLTINDTGQAEKYTLVADSDDFKIAYGSTVLATFQNNGRVGIGSTTPGFQLDLQNGAGDGIRVAGYSTGAGNDARLYLARSNSGTLGTQTAVDNSDALGKVIFQGSNGSSFVTGASVSALARETWSGTQYGTEMSFKVTKTGETSETEALVINKNAQVLMNGGKVGIGTTAPDANILTGVTSGSDHSEIYLGNTGTGNAGVVFDASNGDFAGSDYYMMRQLNSLDVEHWLGDVGNYIWKTDQGTERVRFASDGMCQISGAQLNFINTGSTTTNTTFTRDIDFDGAQGTGLLIASLYHYGSNSYGTSLLSVVSVGAGGYVSQTAVNHTTTNGGSWSVSRVDDTTFRVTHTGGTYAGSGQFFIGFIGNKYTS